jgi:hypothetical protein
MTPIVTKRLIKSLIDISEARALGVIKDRFIKKVETTKT